MIDGAADEAIAVALKKKKKKKKPHKRVNGPRLQVQHVQFLNHVSWAMIRAITDSINCFSCRNLYISWLSTGCFWQLMVSFLSGCMTLNENTPADISPHGLHLLLQREYSFKRIVRSGHYYHAQVVEREKRKGHHD